MRLTRWLIFSIAASLLVLAACSDDGDGASPFELLSPLAGEWSGVWNNDTSGSSAPITMSIVVNDDGTASFAFDLPAADSGSPFGVIAIGPQTFDGTYDENGLSVIIRGDGLFGDMNVTISLEGDLVAEATMAGVLDIVALTVRGSFDGSGMDITYTVRFPGDSGASGSATLTKQ
ncbi:MAG: hypothetical protein IIB87_08120 [Chloroflexi bacterium]|nr:hypothetical protein [Chloroflexota bacterium]